MQNLAKVAIQGTILGMALIMCTAIFSVVTSSALTSESKAEESKEEISEFPSSLIHWEMELNDSPLSSFDDVVSITESETVDEESLDGELQDEDIDPLTYYSELPEPDWSVIPLDQSLAEIIFYEAAENKVDPCVVIALMQSESGFCTDVTSSAGCYGLMQLHPLYYPEDMYDPYRNIHYGVETIGNNLKRSDVNGNYIYALSMYANGHIGSNFTYQEDVMRRAEEWRVTLQEANIL